VEIVDYASLTHPITLNFKDLKTENGLQADFLADCCTFTGKFIA
jgi:hypothetical protein